MSGVNCIVLGVEGGANITGLLERVEPVMNGSLFDTKLLTFNSQRQSVETFLYPSIALPLYARRVDTIDSLEQAFLAAHASSSSIVGGYIFDEVNFHDFFLSLFSNRA